MYKKALILLSLLCASGCSLIIGKLPKPDPAFRAAISKEPQQAIRKYVDNLQPSSPHDLFDKLRHEGFLCKISEPYYTTMECSYTKSAVTISCTTAERVSIRLGFSYDPHNTNNAYNAPLAPGYLLKVETMSVPDPDYHDDRGCFPL